MLLTLHLYYIKPIIFVSVEQNFVYSFHRSWTADNNYIKKSWTVQKHFLPIFGNKQFDAYIRVFLMQDTSHSSLKFMLLVKVSFILNFIIIDRFSYNLLSINKSFSALLSIYKIFGVLSPRALLFDAFKNTTDCSFSWSSCGFGMCFFCKLSFQASIFAVASGAPKNPCSWWSATDLGCKHTSFWMSCCKCFCIKKLFTSKYFLCQRTKWLIDKWIYSS